VGSAGKTSTTAMIVALLRGRFSCVVGTTDDSNGFLGVPITLMRLRRHHEIAVVEIGIDAPGAMVQHLEIVDPTAAIVTSIGAEHLNGLRDIETITEEETLPLYYVAKRGGLSIINLDDARVRARALELGGGPRVAYSLSAYAGSESDDLLRGRLDEQGMLRVAGLGLPPFRIACPMPGAHNARNFLGAIATARSFGASADDLRRGLTTFVAPAGRSEVRLRDGAVFICDYYNASPASVEAALQVLSDSGPKVNRWACLGDMLDLGPEEEAHHRALAPPIVADSIEHVLLFGQRMRWLADELLERRFVGTVHHFDSHEAIVAHLRKGVRSGDRILLKGSRGMAMERIWHLWAQPSS
jgi:UDP-N-acetylmuramoyl-tripeptide--D-alanyl-D-alanine ligase